MDSSLTEEVRRSGWSAQTRERLAYLLPFRFDHWIKNLVVPAGSALSLVAHDAPIGPSVLWSALLGFVVSGLVSSVNYAINEILDAPFDARHPEKRNRPIPSGRVRSRPLLAFTAALVGLAAALTLALFPTAFAVAAGTLFLAGLVYNLPPLRLKDWPYLDAFVESCTNPIRIAIGWYAVLPLSTLAPPLFLLASVWAFGAFLMTGKRLAELRLLGAAAARYRPTFAAYTVCRLLGVELAYGAVGLATLALLFVTERPHLLWAYPLVVLIVAWTLRMTFEPRSPLIDPEHLYRRPVFLALALGTFAVLVVLAVD